MLTSDIDSEATAASESTPCFAPSDQCSQTKIWVKLSCLTPGWWARERKNQWFSVNSRWSNYLLSLHSFQSERRAWLNEYNPLILFCSLIEKPGNVLMRLDRCWESDLILLIALYSPDTLPCFFHSVSQTDKVQHVLPTLWQTVLQVIAFSGNKNIETTVVHWCKVDQAAIMHKKRLIWSHSAQA